MKTLRSLSFALLSLLAAHLPVRAALYQVGQTVENFSLIDRATGQPVQLTDFAGKIIVLDWFAWWCPFCQAAAPQLLTGIDEWYAARGGNPAGLPVLHIGVNLQSGQETQTQNFVNRAGLELVLQDFNRALASRIATSGQPIFAIINGVTNSPSHKPWELLYSRMGYGETSFPIADFRAAIDAVKAAGVTPPTPPSVTGHPTPQIVDQGAPTAFTVAADGTGPLSYQWRKGGVGLAGETFATLSFASAQPADEGSYDCVVSNAVGSVTSAAATLTVRVPPNVTAPPASLTVNPGQNAVFAVAATGTPTLAYQWRKDTVNLPGQTSATLSLSAVAVTDAGSYDCVVSNAAGSVTSAAATLTVRTPPSITSPPVSLTVNPGASAALTVAAVGSPTLTYQWRKDTVPLAGQTAATLSLSAVTATDVGSYDCVVSNAAGSVTSAAAILTVRTPPSITGHPTDRTVDLGESAVLSVAATGSPVLAYQWRKGAVPLPGQTAATLTLNAVTAAAAGSYDCVVSNAAGSATSAAAVLTVRTPLVPPVLAGPVPLADGRFTLVVHGEAGRTYRLEASPDLLAWGSERIFTTTSASETVHLAAAADGAGRYFRVVLP